MASTSAPQREIKAKTRLLAGALGLALVAQSGTAAADPVASAASSFWASVASSAASNSIGKAVAGFALSALGLSSDSVINADLAEIVSLLNEIDAELKVLEDEVQALACLSAQDQATLTGSIAKVQGLYDTFSQWVRNSPTVPCWEESDTSGDVCFAQTGVKEWLDEVMDPANGADAALDAIADVMIQAGNTGVIFVCTENITNKFRSSDGVKDNFLDDGYYSEIDPLTTYYYGVQAQGAALLSEANHLQACLTLGLSECRFTGQSAGMTAPASGATPADPGTICANATEGSQTWADCRNAQSAVAKVYDNVKAQLVQAGAPYTSDLVGLPWGQEGLFAKSLEDFTNNATVNGQKIQTTPCPTPLSSAAPCGFTVGAYNLGINGKQKIGYANYDTWYSANIGNLNALLGAFNQGTSGDTSGTLGQWMNSVGFETAENKIVLTGDTGSNWDTTTICFMDTSLPRGASRQPWCDGKAQSTNNLIAQVGPTVSCGGPCTYYNIGPASLVGSSIDPAFYHLVGTVYSGYDGISYAWGPQPGWFQSQQGNASFHQYHWPVFTLSDLASDWCTVRQKGVAPEDNRNPGGVLSMCGSDLQAWLDAVLQDPNVSFRIRVATGDTTVHRSFRDSNDGNNPRLSLMGTRGVGRHVLIVEFNEERVQRFLDAGRLRKATLVLTIAENFGHWGQSGQKVVAQALADPFDEGNGNMALAEPGNGPGATWNCATDADIADTVKECVDRWSRRFFRPGGATALHYDSLSGPVEWNVTRHVRHGITAFTVRKKGRQRGGSVDYYSKEGASDLFDASLAPTLILER